MLINFGRNFFDHERLFGGDSMLILCNPDPNITELDSSVRFEPTKARYYASQKL